MIRIDKAIVVKVDLNGSVIRQVYVVITQFNLFASERQTRFCFQHRTTNHNRLLFKQRLVEFQSIKNYNRLDVLWILQDLRELPAAYAQEDVSLAIVIDVSRHLSVKHFLLLIYSFLAHEQRLLKIYVA